MKKILWATTIILFAVSVGTLSVLFAASAGPVQVGVAAAVTGEVKDTPEGAAVRLLKSGDKVFMGDIIETGQDGQLQILLLDQTVFTLGPLSAIKIDKFVYDPKTDEGKVQASMMKGIFRVVSGKVAHKKPENMLVNLPAGTIGFRGTNVAGIIDGAKSLIVLLGPVGKGRIFVNNVVNGKVVEVDIDEAGNATIVGGANMAPIPVFQVSEADLQKITNALGQPMTGEGAETTDTGDGSGRTAAQVNAQSLLELLTTMDYIGQQSRDAAQDIVDASAQSSYDSQKSQGGGQAQG